MVEEKCFCLGVCEDRLSREETEGWRFDAYHLYSVLKHSGFHID